MKAVIVYLRKFRGNSLAVLSDGRKLKLPAGSFVWGSVISDSDIVQFDSGYYHRSMVRSKVGKSKPSYNLFRDMSGYDPKAERDLIKNFVLMIFSDVFYRSITNDELEEYTSEVHAYSLEKQWYRRWAPAGYGSYEGYIKSAVWHRLQDLRRHDRLRPDGSALSLNRSIPGGTEEYQNLLQDKHQDVFKEYERVSLLDKFSARVTELDKEGTGLPGFTYKGLFDVLVNGESLDSYLCSFRYDRKLLDQYVLDLRNELKEIAQDEDAAVVNY